jgi:hypothetical protein
VPLRTLLAVTGAIAVIGFATAIAATTLLGDRLRPPSAEASAFFADVRRGDLDAAHARMTVGYRAAHDRPAFRAALTALPGVVGHQRFRLRDARPGHPALVRGEIVGAGGARTAVVTLVPAGGDPDRFAIESLSIDGIELR